MTLKIKGTNGILSWNSLDNKIRFYDNRKKEWRVIYTLKNFQRNKMYVNELNYQMIQEDLLIDFEMPLKIPMLSV